VQSAFVIILNCLTIDFSFLAELLNFLFNFLAYAASLANCLQTSRAAITTPNLEPHAFSLLAAFYYKYRSFASLGFD